MTVDKLRLGAEVSCVERILSLANDSTTLAQAQVESMRFLQEPATGHFSAVDVNEYVLFKCDLVEQRGDINRIANECRKTLDSIQADLRQAKALLKS